MNKNVITRNFEFKTKSNPFLGVFNPPIDGVYLLTVYAVPTQEQNGEMYIKNNDVILCTGYITAGTGYEAGTCSAIAELVVGDSVRVTGNSGGPAVMNAPYCGFTGHIISDNLSA